jgi:hypothetical protein
VPFVRFVVTFPLPSRSVFGVNFIHSILLKNPWLDRYVLDSILAVG